MWEIISPFMLGGLFYCLVMQVAQAVTDGLTGIPEEDAEDEKIN